MKRVLSWFLPLLMLVPMSGCDDDEVFDTILVVLDAVEEVVQELDDDRDFWDELEDLFD